jgi:NAD dependent epimerase/dehydratase family enzyme
VAWDTKSLGDWARELDGATAVVNLTGRSVDCRYNAKNRREIMDSRVNSTRVVGEAIARCQNPAAGLAQFQHGDSVSTHVRPTA